MQIVKQIPGLLLLHETANTTDTILNSKHEWIDLAKYMKCINFFFVSSSVSIWLFGSKSGGIMQDSGHFSFSSFSSAWLSGCYLGNGYLIRLWRGCEPWPIVNTLHNVNIAQKSSNEMLSEMLCSPEDVTNRQCHSSTVPKWPDRINQFSNKDWSRFFLRWSKKPGAIKRFDIMANIV